MFAVHLIQQLLNTQFGFTICPGPGGVPTWIEVVLDLFNVDGIPGTGYYCPGSTFSVVAAAYATQGYIMQSDMLDLLSWNNFSLLAPLAYVIAAIGGFISLAIGQPPRIWVWYFLGPAIYSYLIYTRTETTGVRWQIGHVPQNQTEVWKLAEVGMGPVHVINRPWDMQLGRAFDLVTGSAPNVWVSDFFIWYDALLSSAINDFIAFIGPYSLLQTINPFGGSNIPMASWLGGDANDILRGDRWFLLSNLKWSILEDITSAKLSNPAARDAFATFIGGLCGEAFADSINEVAFSYAAQGEGGNLPGSVFKRIDNNPVSDLVGTPNDMQFLINALRSRPIEYANSSLQKLFYDSGVGSFRRSIFWPPDFPLMSENAPASIYCHNYLEILVDYFRWEASRIFLALVNSAPNTSYNIWETASINDKASKLVYNLFYGWDIKKNRLAPGGEQLGREEARQFLIDLIFVHLVRNEFAIVTQPVDVRYTGSHLAKSYAEGQARTVGSKSKFGEVYVWATLMPYAQGLAMYYLAMLYPFACIVMLVPGMHKSLFTWMSFWAWVKLWDIGFALVTSIERTVWAMIGNSSKAASLHDKVVGMQDWGWTGFGADFDAPLPSVPGQTLLPPVAVCLKDGGGVGGGTCVAVEEAGGVGGVGGYAFGQADAMVHNFQILDRAMTIGPSIDLDLSNAYYIYIMAALYFAVPAVAGQLVLGAKAGVASLVTQALGQNAGEAGRAAASGFSADTKKHVDANFASIGQAAQVAAHQKSGLAMEAIEAGNRQAMHGIEGQAAGAMSSALSNLGRVYDLGSQKIGAGVNSVYAGTRALREYAAMADTPAGPQGPGSNARSHSPLSGTLGGILRAPLAIPAGLAPMVDVGAANIAAGAQVEAANRGQAIAAKQAGLGIDAFQNNAMASAYNRGAGIKEQQAQFNADSAKWEAQNKMASQLGGSLAAMGVNIDSPGPKPSSMMGFAASGMLGGDAKAAASYFFEGGGAFGAINNAAGQIDSVAGFQAVSDAARPMNPGDIWAQATSGASSVVGQVANGAGLGNEIGPLLGAASSQFNQFGEKLGMNSGGFTSGASQLMGEVAPDVGMGSPGPSAATGSPYVK